MEFRRARYKILSRNTLLLLIRIFSNTFYIRWLFSFFLLLWRPKQWVSPLPFVSLCQHIWRFLSRTRIITQWRMPPPAKKSLRTLIHYGSRESPCCRRSNTFVLVAAVWPRYLSFHDSHAWSSTWTRIDSHRIGGKWFLMAILYRINVLEERNGSNRVKHVPFLDVLKKYFFNVLPKKKNWFENLKKFLCHMNMLILVYYIFIYM